jgi:hypothetical protein
MPASAGSLWVMSVPRQGQTESAGASPPDVTVDVVERGANQQTSNRRLFIQLQAFGGVGDGKELISVLASSGIEAVLYADLNDPRGVGVLALAEDPLIFATEFRELLGSPAFAGLERKAELTMLGRTYSSGFESDLEDWLLRRPRRTVLNPAWPWAIWYPLRRVGAFARLAPKEQGAVLREHAILGRAYGDADLGHDIRLACHGLDARDNDFVIGLVGRDLHPLSHLIQTMRKTAQTSEYIQSLGPFFVGHVLWQSRLG